MNGSMRVLLCDAKTRLFLQAVGQWTSEAQSACTFESSLKAALFAQEHGLQNVEVYLDFEDSDYNIWLPVQARAA